MFLARHCLPRVTEERGVNGMNPANRTAPKIAIVMERIKRKSYSSDVNCLRYRIRFDERCSLDDEFNHGL